MGLFHILGWMLFGLIIGALARFLLPGKQSMSLLMTMVLGIAGSLVGGAISWAIFGGSGDYQAAGWIMSIVGAVLVVLLYERMIVKKRGV